MRKDNHVTVAIRVRPPQVCLLGVVLTMLAFSYSIILYVTGWHSVSTASFGGGSRRGRAAIRNGASGNPDGGDSLLVHIRCCVFLLTHCVAQARFQFDQCFGPEATQVDSGTLDFGAQQIR